MATNQKGAYLPTSQVWDVGNIENVEASQSLKELLVRMYQNLGAMATMVNYKDTGIYPTEEFVCGQVYFKDPNLDSSSSKTPKLRQVYRKVINWNKPLPNAVPDSVAHGITFDANTILTRIYGVATDPTHKMYIPIPFIGCKLGIMGIWATETDIVIDCCGFDGTDYTITYVIIEYLKF